jgi:hypothetical protein
MFCKGKVTIRLSLTLLAVYTSQHGSGQKYFSTWQDKVFDFMFKFQKRVALGGSQWDTFQSIKFFTWMKSLDDNSSRVWSEISRLPRASRFDWGPLLPYPSCTTLLEFSTWVTYLCYSMLRWRPWEQLNTIWFLLSRLAPRAPWTKSHAISNETLASQFTLHLVTTKLINTGCQRTDHNVSFKKRKTKKEQYEMKYSTLPHTKPLLVLAYEIIVRSVK